MIYQRNIGKSFQCQYNPCHINSGKLIKHLRCTHFSYRKTVKTNLSYSNNLVFYCCYQSLSHQNKNSSYHLSPPNQQIDGYQSDTFCTGMTSPPLYSRAKRAESGLCSPPLALRAPPKTHCHNITTHLHWSFLTKILVNTQSIASNFCAKAPSQFVRIGFINPASLWCGKQFPEVPLKKFLTNLDYCCKLILIYFITNTFFMQMTMIFVVRQ